MSHHPTPADPAALVEPALAGEPGATRALIDALTPVIQARAVRILARGGRPGGGWSFRQVIEDMTQDVLLALFGGDGRVLRSWDPARGLSLPNFVGLVAERHVLETLRTRKRNPWSDDPTLNEELDEGAHGGAGPEAKVASREALRVLLGRIEARLSPLGMHLFTLLIVQGKAVPEVCEATGMSKTAVYAWQGRLKRLARALAAELADEEARQAGGSG